MKCPICGNECRSGYVEARHAGSLTQASSIVTWYPEESKGKIIKKDFVSLELDAEGYYCDTCMKVFAVFKER